MSVSKLIRFLVAGLALLLPLAATAGSPAPGSPGPGWSETTGGWVAGPVEYVRTIPVEAGGAVDAVLHEGLLYVTSWRSFSIYDVTDPEDPVRLATEPLVAAMWNEQPQTDGEILLVSRDVQYLPPTEHARGGNALDIYDVSDPEAPAHLATYEAELTGLFASYRDHLWTCVLDCRYAYGAGGTILDLSDPSSPTRVGNWTDQAPIEGLHHIAEVAPGVVLTGSTPMHLLDAREDATAPELLATIHPEVWETPTAHGGLPNMFGNPAALPGRVDWPDAMNGRLAVVTKETPLRGECDEHSGDVQTLLTTEWRDTGTFEPAHSYRIAVNGSYGDGAPPYNAWGCSAYGLDVHPSFAQNGGAVAVTFFEHGIRVLGIGVDGRISEEGGFLPLGGNSTRPLWVDEDTLYSIDIHRGIDILRVGTGDR